MCTSIHTGLRFDPDYLYMQMIVVIITHFVFSNQLKFGKLSFFCRSPECTFCNTCVHLHTQYCIHVLNCHVNLTMCVIDSLGRDSQ